MKGQESKIERWGKRLILSLYIPLAVTFIWQFSAGEARRAEADNRSREYAAEAQRRVAQVCAPLEPKAAVQCVAVVISATREHQRSEHNLQAQQETADWTRWMALLSGIAVLISGFGLAALVRTVRQGHDANEIARAAAERELRPYLLFQRVRATPKYDKGLGYWELAFDVINNGPTPARVVSAVTGRAALTEDTKTFDGLQTYRAPEGVPVIPKDGTATFTTTIGMPTLERSERVIPRVGRFNKLMVVANIQYKGLTDSGTECYASEMGRLLEFTHHLDDDYGGGHTDVAEDPSLRHDLIT